MAQFDIHRFERGFNLDVQTNLVSDLNTRLVVPLLPLSVAPKPERRLNPQFEIEGGTYVMVTQYMSAVRSRVLGPVAGNLDDHYDRIKAALDMIFLGF